jgi:IclR family transcriptional regulator, KDG regulon repressor
MGEKNKTVVKSMEVLKLFYSHEQLSLQEIVDLSGMPKTSIHRLIGSLEEMGFLTKNKSGKYSLGLLFLQFGQLVADRLDSRQIALPIMRRLRDELGEAVNLIIREQNEGIYIEKVDTRQPVRVYTQIGRRAPLYAGACPRVILSFLPEEERLEYLDQVELKTIASGTIIDREILHTEIEQCRKKQYTISHSELEDYTSAVAAPIFNHKGEITAGLSVAGPEARFQKEQLPRLIEKVTEAAQEISQKLGWMRQTGREDQNESLSAR